MLLLSFQIISMQGNIYNATKIKKFANSVLKITIVVLGVFFLYKKLYRENGIAEVRDLMTSCFRSTEQTLAVVAALLLMPVNWLCEAKKWQFLIAKLEKLRLFKAMTSVLTGVTIGMFLPNHIGDLFGKVFTLEKGNRVKAMMVSIISGLSQLLCTLTFGCIGVLMLLPRYYTLNNDDLPSWLYFGICIASFCLIGFGFLVYFNIGILEKLSLITPHCFRSKMQSYISIFGQYEKKELFQILMISALRYFVFSFQFVLLIWAFKLPINYFDAMMLISIMYLLMTVIPNITILEPAVRGPVSIFLFDKWFLRQGITTSFSLLVFSASTLLWVINLAIPALIGIFFVYRLKFFRKSDEQ
jgi:Uncharacterised protein family (UPF0104).